MEKKKITKKETTLEEKITISDNESRLLEISLKNNINILEVDRRKLITIFEILSTVTTVDENRKTDSGMSFKRYELDAEATVIRENIVRNCLEQLDLWLISNKIKK